ncbi:SpoIIE family protein phosphatase [Streptomyces sp. NPDC029041]|uniref:SpoIIE family protein phosphatase n=1 Tax=Streptomyces sp. NPDC029041 TaxID=3155727 RepID=UPI0033DC83D8
MAPYNVGRIGAALLDDHGTIIGWPKEAAELVGLPVEEVIGRPVTDLLDRPTDPRAASDFVDGCRAVGGWDGSAVIRRGDGQAVRLLTRVTTLGGGRWLAIAQDQRQAPSELGRMMLDPLLTQSPVGIAILDSDLRYLWVNDALTHHGSLPREHRIGRRPSQVLPAGLGGAVEEQLTRVLASGQPVLGFELIGPSPEDPSRRHSWWNSYFPLREDDKIVGAWYMVVDHTTAAWRTHERLALLTDASARIGSTLDVEVTAEELVLTAVGPFADGASVDLDDTIVQGGEPPPGGVGGDVVLRRAALHSAGGAYPEMSGRVGDTFRAPPDSPTARCLRTGDAVVFHDDSATDAPTTRNAQREQRAHQGVRSVLVLPVRARGVNLGVATFTRDHRHKTFDAMDISLGEELVARAGVCIDNARRFQRERRAALGLQQSLLPHSLADRTALEVASRYLPAGDREVCGDWFDVIPLSGARIALVVGDVVGHGSTAAAIMGQLRTALHTLADLDLPPAEVLARMDDLVVSVSQEQEDDDPRRLDAYVGATCLYAVYDPVSRSCALARAGHPPPALVRPDGTVTVPDVPAGPPLGLGWLPFDAADIPLADGTRIVLFTDGLVEGDRDIDAGFARLREALSHPAEELEALCDRVIDTVQQGTPLLDDVALLVARTQGLGPGQVATWDIPVDPATVAEARMLAGNQITEWELPDLDFATELIVSELVTNAIRHATGPIRLRLIRQKSTLTVEVSDASSTAPRLRHARAGDEGGRGLLLVAHVCRRWGTRYTGEGKIIWTEQDISAGPTR